MKQYFCKSLAEDLPQLKNGFLGREKIIGLLFFMIITWSGIAQSGENPFELKHRLEKTDNTDVEETPALTSSDNPFDVVRLPNPTQRKTTSAKKKITPKPPVVKNDAALTSDKNFRFWLTIAILVLLALISSLYRTQLVRAFRAFGNENVIRMLQREKGTVTYMPYYVWFAFFILNGGFYLYLLMRHQEVSISNSNWGTFLYALAGVAMVFFLKQLAVRMMGYIFPIAKEAELYNMTITIFGIVMGIVLVVLNLFIAYVPEDLLRIFIFSSFIVIGGIYLFRAIRGLSISSKFLGFHKFHFFIYLCTVEIAPVLILWKMMAMNTGIQ